MVGSFLLYTVQESAGQVLDSADATVLETHGWASMALSSSNESDMREQLLAMAFRLGAPVASRGGADLCDILTPRQAHTAPPRSLSQRHSIGEFPLHVDTAHWLTPCRYVMLACISPGRANRPTLLLDVRRLPLDARQVSLLRSTPLRVTNGRNSFFSTVLSKTRPFVRFDPGCMSAVTADGEDALAVLGRSNWPSLVDAVSWEPGKVLIIDNWRLLHGRASADCFDPDRRLLRISIL
jgi:hypothetical protein